MHVLESISELTGGTPLLRLRPLEARFGCAARILAKLEYTNPTGSVKDRAALAMLEAAEKEGRLRRSTVIVEPTSGNTGVALASFAAARGLSAVLVMPETMSAERRELLAAYGARLVLTPGAEGMAGAVRKAREIAASLPDAFLPDQFGNPANPAAHERTTGPEIWADTDGHVDVFAAGAGTGGTLTGTARFLKHKNPGIRVAAVEPAGSAVLSGGAPGPHGIQGIGPGFIPETLDRALIDETVRVTDEEARETARFLARGMGMLVGISSGAAAFAAAMLAARPENAGKTVVTLFPDSGERYLSTGLFQE